MLSACPRPSLLTPAAGLRQGAGEDRTDNESNGSIIAVSYEARAAGVKRIMRGREARRTCPQIQLVQVPTAHGKADLGVYRAAGAEVVSILCTGGTTERASVDEAYVDVTAEAARRLAAARAVGEAEVVRLLGAAAEASAGGTDPGSHVSTADEGRDLDAGSGDDDDGDGSAADAVRP